LRSMGRVPGPIMTQKCAEKKGETSKEGGGGRKKGENLLEKVWAARAKSKH